MIDKTWPGDAAHPFEASTGHGSNVPYMSASDAVINSFSALLDAEDEVAHGFLLAALYVTAVNSDETPRTVLENLFKSLPSDESWPGLRGALLQCLS